MLGEDDMRPTLPPNRTFRMIIVFHIMCVMLCSLAVKCQAQMEDNLLCIPSLAEKCVCQSINTGDDFSVRLVCTGINSTAVFAQANSPSSKVRQVSHIDIVHSTLGSFRLADLSHFDNLVQLSVTHSQIKNLGSLAQKENNEDFLSRFKTLQISWSQIGDENLEQFLKQEVLSRLETLNLSGNAIGSLGKEPVFARMKKLKVLDLSSNLLDESLNDKVFLKLPSTLKRLDISSE